MMLPSRRVSYGGLDHRVQDPKKLTLWGDRPFTLEIG
jgi:hypothetical protein